MDKGNVYDIPDYFSNMSHEVRNALNIMMASCTMATRHIDDKDRVLEYLKRIHMTGDRITGLIDDTLEISRIKHGKKEPFEETFSISDLQEELSSLLDPLAKDKNLDLTISSEVPINRKMTGDYGRLMQVIINLATNSIKYTSAGGKVQISFEEVPREDTETTEFICKCQDNGIGIPEDFLEHIFEPFARADDEKVRKINGSGLGMAIIKEAVDAMGGSIHIDSMLGVGTIVSFRLKMKNNIIEKDD